MARQRMAEVLYGQVATIRANTLSSPELRSLAANSCRAMRDSIIQDGRASSVYLTSVDGRFREREETVRLDGGVVRYVFSYLAQAAAYALAYCQDRSPARSGAFRKAWVVRVNDKLWTRPLAAIQPGQRVEIVNTMPYARKIDTGGQITSVPPGLVEAARQATLRQFSTLSVQRKFIVLTEGQDARGGALPYVLKAQGIDSGLSFSKKTGFERLRPRSVTRRKDRAAGQPLTYPALVLTETDDG